jgi:hypothetical protein
MGFSVKQVKALRRNLDHRCVRTRESNGRTLSYIEGWYAISEANRIFGFDSWNRETIESRCVLARENRGSFLAVYTARVRISVYAGGIIRDIPAVIRIWVRVQPLWIRCIPAVIRIWIRVHPLSELPATLLRICQQAVVAILIARSA